MTHTPIPHDLHDAVLALPFECASDGRLARHAVAHPERATRATVQWLAALVARGGARYDDRNPAHSGPHDWPLKSGHTAAAVVAGVSPWQDAPSTPGSAAGSMPQPLPMPMPAPAPTAAGALLSQPPPPFSVVSSFMP